MTIMLGSIGSQLGRGETALDLLPFEIGIYTPPSLGVVSSLIMFVFSGLTLAFVLFAQPRPVIE